MLHGSTRIASDWTNLRQPPLNPAGRLPKSKYAERVAAKHPATLDKRFIHPRPEQKEG